MSIINNICEHVHLERKCEVCELKAEIARLRSVCRRLSNELRISTDGPKQDHGLNVMLMRCVANDLADAGKEPSDGE